MIRLLSFTTATAFVACADNKRTEEHPLISFQEESAIHDQDTVNLPASCIGADDGYQWMKMLDGDDYPAVHQLCDNEYMVIDINEDSNILDYFASYAVWHSALGGSEGGSSDNWEEWWLPNAQYLATQSTDSEEYFSYIISPDCSSCDVAQNTEDNYLSPWNTDDYGDRTAYYMTGTIFGCLTSEKQEKDCMWNTDTYECSLCSIDSSDQDLGYHVIWQDDDDFDFYSRADVASDINVGLCGVYPKATYNSSEIPSSRGTCMGVAGNYKPSIGNKGEFCVCVKPNESYDADTTYSISSSDFDSAQQQYEEQHAATEEDTSSIGDIYELYQSDFMNGTYRIQKSGTYKIMEDIVFDFENGNDWWPSSEQEEYPGADTSRDEYYFGFLAGITVETDDVIIDLNEHEIKQSVALYHQQRFFSCISLKSVAFPLNQGPGFFGTEPKYANNVVIKNGNIGLSSHHAIHGHYNEDVLIEDVHVYDFETHGIQMSYFKNLKMKNVEIGPSSTMAYLNGEYAHARFTLQRLNRIIESDYNETAFPLTFSGRDEALSLQDIIDNLQNQVDIAFAVVMGTEEYDDDDEDYIAAKELFINEDGLPYGAIMYGLFLNLAVANVFTIHPSLNHAQGAEIENLKIHGLYHNMDEYIRMDNGMNSPYQTMFGSSMDARAILGDQIEIGQNITWSEVSYVGSALTDAFIALGIATTDWGEAGLLYLEEDKSPFQLRKWALGQYEWDDSMDWGHPWLGCNNDRMTHAPKGVMGIRMDGVNDVRFTNLEISDLYEASPLGSELCGEYWECDYGFGDNFHGGGHFLQNTPYFYGYTGNRVHGIFADWANVSFSGKIDIHDLTSETGLVRGIGMYTESLLEVEEDASIAIHDLKAGTALSEVDTDALAHPYAPAEAKPIHLLSFITTENNDFYSDIIGDKEAVIPSVWCLYGRDGVNTSDWTVSMNDDMECSMDMVSETAFNVNTKVHTDLLGDFDILKVMMWVTLLNMMGCGVWYGYKRVKSKSTGSANKESLSTENDPLLQAN